MPGVISIHRATQNNLKGISVHIPHRALTVITGPSGSGKSSLAFDTLYAEGQRRYIESLSTYAKQFLERMPKPAVERIEGIFPAIAIEQKNPTTSSRSTVGTATEINDYLRLLWARAGTQRCHDCGGPVTREDPSSGAIRVVRDFAGEATVVTFPLPRSAHPNHELLVENLSAMGFVRVLVRGTTHRLDALPSDIHLDTETEVLVAVDRIRAEDRHRVRFADSLAVAFREGDGLATVVAGDRRLDLSDRARCEDCGTTALPLTPTSFSFNNPRGACPTCNGFGAVLEYDESLIIPDPNRTLAEGAIDPWTKPRYTTRRRLLHDTAVREGIPTDVAWSRLPAPGRRFLLEASKGHFRGALPFLRGLEPKRYKQYIRVFLRQYQLAKPCPACEGARLRPEALAVFIDGRTIAQVGALSAEDALRWIDDLSLPPFTAEVAEPVVGEVSSRLHYLADVGLGYLTLDRQTRTLSGGEAQRIALANALGSRLVDTMYVLDEPSIGLHARDIDRLLGLVARLRDTGNTVVIVEHDLDAVRQADHMIELGPGSGANGGDVVYAGPPDAGSGTSLTTAYLTGERSIPVPSARRPTGPLWLHIRGARHHNLAGVDADIPLHALTVVTGVSGSGKSTLVHDVVYRHLALRLKGSSGAKEHLGETIGVVEEMSGWEKLSEVILVDQSPIGRSPRSNPITYVRAFDEIRSLFAREPLARARGLTPTDFSFNAANGGRCRTCEGAGHLQVEMVFLADVFVPCEACGGSRFAPEILDITIKGRTIHDVLELTVDEAIIRFRHQDKLGRSLWHLQQVGLGYLRLGQPATTLSGGEAQRLKIARQLAGTARQTKRRLYILDEPTTGLHLDDIKTLLKVLDRLVDAGNTVVVIEHHLDVIKRADWVIDLGPEGGVGGGQVVATGTPEEVAATETHTGRYLRGLLAPTAGVPA